MAYAGYSYRLSSPSLNGPAFYLTTAENPVNGRGLEIDGLRSYHILFPGVTHPRREHWMPLPTGLTTAASDWEVYYQPIACGWLDVSLIRYRDTRWGFGCWSPSWLLWLLPC